MYNGDVNSRGLRIARVGAVGLLGMALLVYIWLGLVGLSAAAETGHCRDTQSGELFTSLRGAPGPVDLVDGGNGRCEIPGSDGTGDWTIGDGKAFDITGGVTTGGAWLLSTRYEWRESYAMASSLAGQALGALSPLMGVLAFAAMVGLVVQEWLY